jgi:hypothetical protein
MPRGFQVPIYTVAIPRRVLAAWAVGGMAGVLLPGCGPRSNVVESPPPVELSDSQVRDLLKATIESGDASSDLYMNFQRQLSSGAAASRGDAGEIRAMLDEMIVVNDRAKNRAYAEKILKKW